MERMGAVVGLLCNMWTRRKKEGAYMRERILSRYLPMDELKVQ